MSYHEPVMAREALEALAIDPEGTYVDATFGGGGHAKMILGQLGGKGRLIAFDQDEDAQRNLPEDPRLTFVASNFRHLKRFLRLHRVEAVDGILADLGVSSHQLDEPGRGFSYRFDSLLDMRMNKEETTTAASILNTYSAEKLQEVFSRFGEIRNARSLAQRVVSERASRELRSIGDLLAVADPLVRGHRPRYLSQLFQALRIEVNDEMGALESFLDQTLDVLSPGGRLVILTYHSLEDRMVKNFLRSGNVEGEVEQDFYGNIYRPFRLITPKPVEPGADEIERNPRARSARLRCGERLEEQEIQEKDN